MPTTRRPVNRYANRGLELTAEHLDILMLGWSAPEPEGGYGPNHKRFDVFWLAWPADWLALWQQHRALVLEEWKRRGGQGFTFAEQVFEGQPGQYNEPFKSM